MYIGWLDINIETNWAVCRSDLTDGRALFTMISYLCIMQTSPIPIEDHPLEPFLPEEAQILMLGSFPPKRERWSMDFFYPNFINDMWRIMGLVFFNDKEHFICKGIKAFDREQCAGFAAGKGIAMYDTACQVRRLKDNASDKFLEVVTPTDLHSLLEKIPACQAIVTTGQKATDVIVAIFGCTEPPVGEYSEFAINGRNMRLWRMPSSSRAYPLALERKAAFYMNMFKKENML